MRVRDWTDILADVTERSTDPAGWRAVAGDRERGLGEDLYLGHPGVGVFHLKTYAKNPFEVRGVGTQVARRIDDELDPLFPDSERSDGRFAVRGSVGEDDVDTVAARVAETIRTHADAPTTRDALFDDVMDAMDSPAYGPLAMDAEDDDQLAELAGTFEEANELLDAELDDLIDEDDVGRGFM